MQNRIFKSKDGITIIYEYIPNIKGVVFELHFKAGSNNDPIGKAGLAHFCEHVLMGFSTKKHSREQRNKIIMKYQYFNAYTGFNEMVFIVSATNKEIGGAVDFLTEPFSDVIVSEKEFASEFKIISDEIKTRRLTNSGLLGLILDKNQARNKEIRNHEYTAAGSIETISKIKTSDIKKFISLYINKENLVVNVVGNIKKKEIEKLIEKYVSPRVKEYGKKGFSRIDNLGDKGPHYYYAKPYEKEKGIINFDYQLEKREKSVYYDRRVAAVNRITKGLLNEIAYNFFRQNKELCYSCSVGYSQYIDTTYFSFKVECSKENIDNILNVYPEFINKILDEITEERFKTRINRILGSINFDQTGIFNRADENYSDYNRFGTILGNEEYEYYEKLYNSITYQEIIDRIKLIKGKKPNIVIITEDEKYKDFDYNEYCKKIKIKK